MLVLCPSNTYMGSRFEFHRGWGEVALPLHHGGVFALKGSAPSRVYCLAGTEEEPPQPRLVTECVKRVMVVYTRIFYFFYVLICCFTSTVSSWVMSEQSVT